MPVIERLIGKRYRHAIATVELHGEIVPLPPRGIGHAVTPAHVRDVLDEVAGDRNVKGVIFDINSPGGAIVASREVSAAVEAFPKPTVAWIRDVGASGAYEVATACRRIVADPFSLVGSIGVILPHVEVVDLLGKIGVRAEVLKAGRLKDLGVPLRAMTDEERRLLQDDLEVAHRAFLERVAARRRLSPEQQDEVRSGRVFHGERALALGLVDELGSRKEAIRACEELGGFTHDEVVPFKKGRRAGFLGRVVDFFSGEEGIDAGAGAAGLLALAGARLGASLVEGAVAALAARLRAPLGPPRA